MQVFGEICVSWLEHQHIVFEHVESHNGSAGTPSEYFSQVCSHMIHLCGLRRRIIHWKTASPAKSEASEMLGCSSSDFSLYTAIYNRKEGKKLPVTFNPPLCFPFFDFQHFYTQRFCFTCSWMKSVQCRQNFFGFSKGFFERSTEWSTGCHLFQIQTLLPQS